MASKPLVIKSIPQLLRSIQTAGPNRVYHAYKYSMADGRSPFNPNTRPVLNTRVGAVLQVKRANCDPRRSCGAGVNVATRKFCVSSYRHDSFCGPFPRYNLFVVEFRKKDIACVPKYGAGKFRLFECKVIKQVKVRPLKRQPSF